MNSIERIYKSLKSLVTEINYLVDDDTLPASAKEHPSYKEAIESIVAFELESINMVNNFRKINTNKYNS